MKAPKEKDVEIILLRETALQSVISDCFTFVMVVGIIGVGVVVGSSAMQWAGFLMLLFYLFAHVIKKSEGMRMDIEGARKKLDEIESERKAKASNSNVHYI